MMKLSINAIKKIAAYAVLVPASCLFSYEISAQPVSDPLLMRIEISERRVAPLRAKNQEPRQRYALEKAQCWLDFAKHEALRNNPTPMPELAHQKATELLGALEANVPLTSSATDSALSVGEKRMRNDLWAQLDSVKSSKQLSCAAKAVACGEVMLVQAAHAYERIDWRYAQPYFGMAEDWARAAKQQAQACPAQP